MRRLLLNSALWWLPVLVVGSTVLPAFHQAVHHGGDVTLPGATVQSDEACTLCEGPLAETVPAPPTLSALGGLPGVPGEAPLPAGQRVVLLRQGRAPPLG